jgi:lauroyl/myristoyl acyltransferase
MFPKGIISIAKETHVPLLPFFSFLDGGKRRRIFFEKPFFVDDVEEGVKTCVKLIEKEVVQRPDHWHLWPVAHQFFINPT